MQAPSQNLSPEAVAAAARPEPGLLQRALDAAASGRAAYPGLTARVLGSLLLPVLALCISWALFWAVGRPPQLGLGGDTLLVLPLLLGQAAALWHWFVGGAVFVRGVRLFTLLTGLALGVWLLLILEPLQRFTLQAALSLSRGTPWEGLASGLSWAVLACAVPLLAVACLLLWRQLAQAVLAGRVAVSAAHDLVLVLCITALAVVVWALSAPLGLPGPTALALGDRPWTVVAQRLSLFVDGPALMLLIFSVMYALLRLALGWLQADSRRGGPAAMAPLPPLVVLDLRRAQDCSLRATQDLHALACTWGQARGPVLLVRLAAQALQGGGQHLRWAQAARRLPELFVSGADPARRWCATWLASDSGPFLRECLLGPEGGMRHLVLALRTAAPGALFLLVPGVGLSNTELERLRLALPKARCLLLAPGEPLALGESGSTPLARLVRIDAGLRRPWQRQALVQALTRRLQSPQQQRRLAVTGRPRSDRLADAVVAAVDQRVLAGHDTPVDAQRPARDAQGGFDRLLLLLDPAWLAGDTEALVEVAALQTLVQGVLGVNAGALPGVALMSTGDTDAAPTQQAVARAWARCGGVGAAAYLGHLPEDPLTWADQGALDRLFKGGEVALPLAVEPAPAPTDSAPTPPPAAAAPRSAPRALSEFGHAACLSYAHADDEAWSGWIRSFGKELQMGLATRLRDVKLPPLLLSDDAAPVQSNFSVALAERLASAFALIIVVHDRYAQSEWCQRELQMFVDQRAGTDWQQQIYVIAMSRPAVEALMRSPHWQRAVQGQALTWLPFFDPQAPDRPLHIYSEGGQVAQQFHQAVMQLRDAFAEQLRQAALLPLPMRSTPPAPPTPTTPPTPPVADAGRAPRIYIESSREQPYLWEALGQHMQRLWDELQLAWAPASEDTPRLRLRVQPLDDLDLRSSLADADAVVLLVGAKPLELLLDQIETVESHPPSGRVSGLLVAVAQPALTDTVLPWPVLAVASRESFGAGFPQADHAALMAFLHRVWEHHRPQPQA